QRLHGEGVANDERRGDRLWRVHRGLVEETWFAGEAARLHRGVDALAALEAAHEERADHVTEHGSAPADAAPAAVAGQLSASAVPGAHHARRLVADDVEVAVGEGDRGHEEARHAQRAQA